MLQGLCTPFILLHLGSCLFLLPPTLLIESQGTFWESVLASLPMWTLNYPIYVCCLFPFSQSPCFKCEYEFCTDLVWSHWTHQYPGTEGTLGEKTQPDSCGVAAVRTALLPATGAGDNCRCSCTGTPIFMVKIIKPWFILAMNPCEVKAFLKPFVSQQEQVSCRTMEVIYTFNLGVI